MPIMCKICGEIWSDEELEQLTPEEREMLISGEMCPMCPIIQCDVCGYWEPGYTNRGDKCPICERGVLK